MAADTEKKHSTNICSQLHFVYLSVRVKCVYISLSLHLSLSVARAELNGRGDDISFKTLQKKNYLRCFLVIHPEQNLLISNIMCILRNHSMYRKHFTLEQDNRINPRKLSSLEHCVCVFRVFYLRHPPQSLFTHPIKVYNSSERVHALHTNNKRITKHTHTTAPPPSPWSPSSTIRNVSQQVRKLIHRQPADTD